MSLVIVGSVAFDALETPFGKTDRIIGGAATYAALTAAYFTQPVQLVAVVGGDFPKQKLDLFRRRGIDLAGLQVRENEKSFFWSGRYHNDMNTRDTLATELNVLADFDPVLPDAYRHAPYVLLGNLTPAVQLRVLDQMAQPPRLVVLDTMNFWMDTALDALRQVIARVDVLSINDAEARQLSGAYALARAAQVIMAMGPKVVIIKKGEHGALLFRGREVFFAPALPLEEVFDPTGAGDTFAGGFMGYLARSNDTSFENMKRAVIYGSAMASFCVERFGTERLEQLTETEIEQRVASFVNLVQFELTLD